MVSTRSSRTPHRDSWRTNRYGSTGATSPPSSFRKIRVVLDLANLVDVPLGVRGDFQHPLPAVDHLSIISKAVPTQVVVGGLDIFDHGGCAVPETSREPRSSPC